MHYPSRLFLPLLVLTVTGVSSFPIASRAGAFGSCSNPTIIFANGLDGRSGPAFAPANSADFDHGSALDIGIISSFICGQLSSKCDASQGAISACASASSAASKETGQAAAATFNSIISGASSFSSQQQSNTEGKQNVSKESQNNQQQQQKQQQNQQNQQNQQQQQQQNTSSGSGGNLQHFTGSLGGAAPAVTAGGKGFVVAGSDDFVNLNGALGRSCDIQHNACADAANSGNSSFSVNDCDAQDAQCRAAN